MPLKDRILVVPPLIILVISFSGSPSGQPALNDGQSARAFALQEVLSSIEGVAEGAEKN